MGLDGVEIVMQIEEEFGIELPDSELTSVQTVGDLYMLVLGKVESNGTQSAAASLTTKVFYRLRKAMRKCLGQQRKFLMPSTKLAHLLPKPTRIAAWKCLEEVSELTFPKLRHPRWARDTYRVVAVGAGIAFLWAMASWSRPSGFLWVPLLLATVVVGGFVLKGLYAATPFLAWELTMRSAGELAQVLLESNVTAFLRETGDQNPSRQEVWTRLVYIFSDQQQLRPAEIVPEARIREDLGIE